MVLMAGMLPGVECARRRRLRQSSGGAEAPCGTRRPSLCLYAGGSDHAHLGSSTASKERSSGGVCKEMSRAWTLDSNAREAKERLDQKLRGQRESVVKRHLTSTGTVRPPAAKPQAANTSSGCKNLHHPATAGTAPCVLQREVFSKPRSGGGAPCWRRRFSWGRSRPAEAEEWECAVWCAWRSSAEGTWWRSCPARTASTGPGRLPLPRLPRPSPPRLLPHLTTGWPADLAAGAVAAAD